jgi:hypothetical protein
MSHAQLRFLRALATLSVVSLFAASCLTPSFKLDDGGGSGGLGGGRPVDHCTNGVTDRGETARDCGGPDCDPCEIGQRCLENRDCKNNSCVDEICAAPTCSDDTQNQDETDKDCGGKTCEARCSVGDRCLVDEDCETNACRSRVCVESSCNDNKQNSGETDIDCGGSICGATCDTGQRCRSHSDCLQPDDPETGTARCVDDDPDDGVNEKRCRLTCPVRYSDCDELAKNGCETNTNTSTEHCGACGAVCNPPHTVTPLCDAGQCKFDTSAGADGCVSGYANCDGQWANGCEANLQRSIATCGSCDVACSDKNGEASCVSGTCRITCDPGFRDCDKDPGKNGCETNIWKDSGNCGGCGDEDDAYICEGDVAMGIYPACVDGDCETTDCSEAPGFGACDGDGLCNDSLTTPENCGRCGGTCVVQNGTPSCEVNDGVASCGIKQCDRNFANCDADLRDCEVDVRTNEEHCGGCAGSGGVSCVGLETTASLRVEDAICEDSECRIVACDAGYADCDGKATNGCEVRLGQSINNCEVCGDTCGGTNPFCDPVSGCMHRPPITRVQQVTGQATSGNEATVTIDVSSGPNRALVIAVASVTAPTIRYQGNGIPAIISSAIPDTTGGASQIAFVSDANIGAAGTKTIKVSSDWGGTVVTVFELRNVNQTSFVTKTTNTPDDCMGGTPMDVSHSVTVGSAGSFTVASLAAQGNAPGASGTPIGLTEVAEVFQQDQITGLAGYSTSSSNFTAGWTLTGTCYGSALATATFESAPTTWP